MENRFKGKTVLITGGTTGIGLATAKKLIAGGAKVLVTGRNEKNLQAARAELGPDASLIKSDTSSIADIKKLVEKVIGELGSIDLLYVNAGIAIAELSDKVTEASYDNQFAINTKGAFFTVQQLTPYIKDGGAIVFTSSVADGRGIPGANIYSATKAALRSFAKVFATELLPKGIRVNVVSPGYIKTPTMGIPGASMEDIIHFEREGAKRTPMGRIGSPEEVAQAVIYLAFEATFTTGIVLPVDGGIAQGLVSLT